RESAEGRNLCSLPLKHRVRLALFCLLHSALCIAVAAQTVRITDKPEGLVHGILNVPIVATDPVTRVALFINNVKYTESPSKQMVAQVRLGDYIRRMRMRAVGYDAQGNIAGEDEMVVNDPRPPFRVKAIATRGSITATVIHPVETQVTSVDLYLGEEKIATVASPPYVATYDAAKYPNPLYARVVAHSSDGNEANDVFFFRADMSGSVDVNLEQVPISIAGGSKPLRVEDLSLFDEGEPRKIEALVPAADQPLYVVLLIDYSESMLEELPVVSAAAKQFAKTLLRPQDRIAIVGFNQKTFWLTAFTNDWNAAASAV